MRSISSTEGLSPKHVKLPPPGTPPAKLWISPKIDRAKLVLRSHDWSLEKRIWDLGQKRCNTPVPRAKTPAANVDPIMHPGHHRDSRLGAKLLPVRAQTAPTPAQTAFPVDISLKNWSHHAPARSHHWKENKRCQLQGLRVFAQRHREISSHERYPLLHSSSVPSFSFEYWDDEHEQQDLTQTRNRKNSAGDDDDEIIGGSRSLQRLGKDLQAGQAITKEGEKGAGSVNYGVASTKMLQKQQADPRVQAVNELHHKREAKKAKKHESSEAWKEWQHGEGKEGKPASDDEGSDVGSLQNSSVSGKEKRNKNSIANEATVTDPKTRRTAFTGHRSSSTPNGFELDAEEDDSEFVAFTHEQCAYFVDIFEKYDEDGSGDIDIQELGFLLMECLKTAPSMALVRDILEDVDEDGSGTLDFDEFLVLMEQYQKEANKDDAARAFFSEDEVDEFMMLFNSYDKDRSGALSVIELDPLLTTLGKAPKTKQEQQTLTKVLSEIDADRSGQIDFGEFLQLLRRFIDEQEHEMHKREETAMAGSGMSNEEIHGYREVFLAFDEAGRGVLGLPEIRRLLRAIGLQLDAKKAEELREIFQNLDDDGDCHSLNFIEFLHMIRKLLDVNFCGIKEKVDKVLAKLEEDRKREAKRQEMMEKHEKERMKRREQLIKRASKGLRAVELIRDQNRPRSAGAEHTDTAAKDKDDAPKKSSVNRRSSVDVADLGQLNSPTGSDNAPNSMDAPDDGTAEAGDVSFEQKRQLRRSQSDALKKKREARKSRQSDLAREMRAKSQHRGSIDAKEGEDGPMDVEDEGPLRKTVIVDGD